MSGACGEYERAASYRMCGRILAWRMKWKRKRTRASLGCLPNIPSCSAQERLSQESQLRRQAGTNISLLLSSAAVSRIGNFAAASLRGDRGLGRVPVPEGTRQTHGAGRIASLDQPEPREKACEAASASSD